jgi:nucleotide-binding universal stress UspA family protein
VGSTTVEVAAQARCPVVVVRDRLPVTSLRHGVVVGSDGSEGSRAALEEAFRRAARLGMALTVVHVWSVRYAGADVLVPDLEVERLRTGEYGRALTAKMVSEVAERYPHVALQQEVVHGDPRRVLTDVSRGAEMLVVGSRGRGEVTGLLLGSVSQALLRHASCPVMVVRPGAASH